MISGETSVTSFQADNFSANEAPPGSRWYVATLRYLTDLEREVSLPVGVLLFAEGIPLWGVRTPRADESLSGISPESLPGILLMRDLIRGWLQSGNLPYVDETLPPYSLVWWLHLAGLMGHRLRIEGIRPTLCEHPKADMETLYHVIVRPADKSARKDSAESLATSKGSALAEA